MVSFTKVRKYIILTRRLTGKFHLSGATKISRYDFARGLCRAFGLDASLLRTVTMKDMSWFANGPADSSLDVSKAIRTIRAR